MRINHNIAALNTYRQLSINNTNVQKSLEKLSSGLRINRAGDDAAGLAISEKMRGQIRGLEMATKNAQDGISLIQTAEGALNEVHSILQRMRELAVQASNDTATDADRTELQKEIAQLKEEIDRISNTTEFNTKKLLNGDLAAARTAQGDILESAKLNIINGIKVDPTENAITIVAGQNDTLVINDGTTDQTITLTAGTYTMSELATEVQTKVQAVGGTLANVSVSAAGNQLTFTNNDTSNSIIVKTTGTASAALGISNNINVAASGGTGTTGNVALDSYELTATDNQFNIAVNGATPTQITLTANEYKTIEDLITEINTQLTNNNIAVTAVKDGSSIVFKAKNASDTFQITSGSNDATAAGRVLSGAATTSSKLLTLLQNEDGDSLGIKVGDVIKINGQINGSSINTVSYTVTGTSTVENLMTEIEKAFGLPSGSVTLNSDNEIVIKGKDGEANALQNIKLSIDGNAKFNDHFSNFIEIQDAQDTTTNNALTFHIGANQDQVLRLNIEEMSVGSLSLSSVDISTQQGAENSITVINNALEKVSSERAKLGAVQNRLEHTINNLSTSAENLTAAESRIRDVDMAKEMMEFTKNNILTQAAQAMLAQSNNLPQGVLQLLR